MTSKLIQMQSRFQQKQMQEREEKLLKLYENQQQRAFERVGRGSAGSNTSVGSTGGGKVRQMFDERRQKAGVDRSYPLEPLKPKSNGTRGGSVDRNNGPGRTVVRSTVQSSNSVSAVRNGKPMVNKKEVVKSVYSNNNGRESFERQVYEENGNNTHRELMEMMNNHSIDDGLDNEIMPKFDGDEMDHYNHNVVNGSKTGRKKPDTVKTAAPKPNGLAKKESEPQPRKVATRSTPSPSKPSPKTPFLSFITKQPAKPMSKSQQETTKTQKVKTGPSSSQKSVASKASARTAVERDDLAACSYCGRRFAPDRIKKHEDVCAKTGKKKRKPFDATKHRVQGTELESYVTKGPKGKNVVAKLSKPAPKKDWRRTHEDFINAIRAAKEAQAHLAKGGKLSDLPPPPPSSNPDYVQCPHCGRKFNQSAAERHIPKCASYQFNKPKTAPKRK